MSFKLNIGLSEYSFKSNDELLDQLLRWSYSDYDHPKVLMALIALIRSGMIELKSIENV